MISTQSEAAGRESTRTILSWRLIGALIRYRPRLFALLGALEILFYVAFPHAIGLLTQNLFDRLTGDAPVGASPTALIALMIAAVFGRGISMLSGVALLPYLQFSMAGLLRRNLLDQMLDESQFRPMRISSGDAVSRFRDDVEEVAEFTIELLTVFGFTLFAIIALIIMLQIDLTIALLVFLPLSIVVYATTKAMENVKRFRRISREAAGRVSEFIGEILGAVQAIKVANAEKHALRHLGELNDVRMEAVLKDRLFSEFLRSVVSNAINLGTGLILIFAAQSMRSGTFTVGDLALFVFYLGFVAEFTEIVGTTWAWYRQIEISLERLLAFLGKSDPGLLVEHKPLYLHGLIPNSQVESNPAIEPLQRLEVEGLSYHFQDSKKGIEDVTFSIEKGTTTVITGRVGSGKTTLLRVLLGLLPKQSGEIRWNRHRVENPAFFFRPPLSAYTGQVPVLFSGKLIDSILMGLPRDQSSISRAIYQAVLEDDLEGFEEGLETEVGIQGIKLSGGQAQRTAAARMFVRQPELLVFDDLSSALDVETENKLWERLRQTSGVTCIVVAHRPAAFEHADQIIILKHGRVVARGTLKELMENSEEMRQLYQRPSEEGVA